MAGVHDRPTMSMMLKRGRRSREIHRAIMLEVNRLDDRMENLTRLKSEGDEFVAQLAAEQEKRLETRINVLLRGHQYVHLGRPRGIRYTGQR